MNATNQSGVGILAMKYAHLHYIHSNFLSKGAIKMAGFCYDGSVGTGPFLGQSHIFFLYFARSPF